MGARENILVVGLNGLFSLTAPAFTGPAGRKAADYFLEAGEYIGAGFNQAKHEAENQSDEKQLELFAEKGV